MRVTESLGSTLMVVLGVVAFATLIVLSRIPLGTQVIVRLRGRRRRGAVRRAPRRLVAPMPRVAPQVPRGGIGVIVGAMVGTAVAGLSAGYLLDGFSRFRRRVAGLAAAVIAVMVDLSVGYAEAGRRLAGDAPSLVAGAAHAGPADGFALAAPVAYVGQPDPGVRVVTSATG